MKIVIAMPVYNDWPAAAMLISRLGRALANNARNQASILLIDDGSSAPVQSSLFLDCCTEEVSEVDILHLNRNLGHQRAIAIGLTYIFEHLQCDAVVVMDADGEDLAEDVPRLLAPIEEEPDRLVFAERGRRVEGILFKAGYVFYRGLHWLATGKGIKVGNFSAVPFSRLKTLVVLPELWNHYAAAVLRARLPYTTVVAHRGPRLQGQSRMNFTSLVIHGLSALFAQYELVGTRIFVAFALLTTVLVLVMAIGFGAWVYQGGSLPLWALLATATGLLLAGELLALSFGLVFFIMVSRTNQGFLPIRDYSFFVEGFEALSVRRIRRNTVAGDRK